MSNENIPNKHDHDGAAAYRQFMPDITTPRFTSMQKQDSYEYVDAFKKSQHPPWFHALYVHWQQLAKEPFRGVTTDG